MGALFWDIADLLPKDGASLILALDHRKPLLF